MPLSDQELLARIRQDDEAAFEALFRTHYAVLCGFARKFVRDPEEAEEIVQELFAGLWERRHRIELAASWRAYLFRAARNACLNHLKHLKVRARHEEEVNLSPPGPFPDAAEALEAAELKARIAGAIEELPDRCREAFRLSRFQGLKYAEIAEKMDISPRTVEVQIGKALRLLRRALKDVLPLFPWLWILFLE